MKTQIKIDVDTLAERAARIADILMVDRNEIKTGYGKKKHHGILDLILRKICDEEYFTFYDYPLADYVNRGRRLANKRGIK